MGVQPVYFNSWSKKYRHPFGAVQAGQYVRFSIDVHLNDVLRVFLVIQKDGAAFRSLEMSPDSEQSQAYTIKFAAQGEAGLYFYHFQIDYREEGVREKTIFYGKAADRCEGEGRMEENKAAVQQYQLTCFRYRDPAPEWFTRGVIYHIFVDRFNNGNRYHTVDHPKKNSFIYATEEDIPFYIRDGQGNIARWDFFGGNLKGIIDKLRYLRDLGITILFLSPIFEAGSNHKYNTGDFRKIDSMFGTKKTFQKLIDKARRMGIHIILDGVFNHVGADSIYFNRFGHYGRGGACQDIHSPYYRWFTFHSYPDSYDSWWNIADLPVADKNNESYRQFIYRSDQSIIHTWTKTGIGGWRLDVADELPDDFIEGIRTELDRHNTPGDEKILIGEVWEDASNKIAYGRRRHYLEGGKLHGVMNYPFRSMIIDLLLGKIDARQAVRLSLTLKSNYPPEAFLANMNNIGTHDTERILSVLGGDEQKLRLAAWLLLTLPGVPCIYYGDEAGLTGEKDPDNRRFFPWGRENRQIETFFREAIHRRRTDENLQYGDYLPFYAGKLFGFIRLQDETAYTGMIFNTTKENQIYDSEQIADETADSHMKPRLNMLFGNRAEILPWHMLLRSVPRGK